MHAPGSTQRANLSCFLWAKASLTPILGVPARARNHSGAVSHSFGSAEKQAGQTSVYDKIALLLKSVLTCARLCAVRLPTCFHLPVQALYAARRGPRPWSGLESPRLTGNTINMCPSAIDCPRRRGLPCLFGSSGIIYPGPVESLRWLSGGSPLPELKAFCYLCRCWSQAVHHCGTGPGWSPQG